MVLFYEDLHVGQVFESVGRTVTDHDVMTFAGISGDFNQLHTDDEFAKKSNFGTRIAHGVLILGIATGLTQRMGIFDGSAIALLGLEWDFKGPVKINDTIYLRMTIGSLRESKKGDRGIVVRDYEILNQHEEVVQTGKITVMIRKRPKD
ncbi:MaoC/PaaZ C-terminal domain-containing protein [Pontivivens nitratireducens]|uniref:Dehydratase n=1 Tax=Pontivivens nitratireducens TaxID=2758038 RepID=A0A6G7VNY2_9RHOB|nr:MaoC/PaaZ C-terminal domain-containing protein [Pontibrevibacter nitratireducens]QIK41575.1 dehydratase [Pontibrevibacter nitratireducens]